MAGLFAGLLLAASVFLTGCSKEEETRNGGYEFGGIYLYVNGARAEMHEMTIMLPPEEGYADIEIVSGRLNRPKYLKGDNEDITLEIPGPFEANPDDPWLTRQAMRIHHTANPGVKSRSCEYRLFADVACGAAADVTFVQSGRKN